MKLGMRSSLLRTAILHSKIYKATLSVICFQSFAFDLQGVGYNAFNQSTSKPESPSSIYLSSHRLYPAAGSAIIDLYKLLITLGHKYKLLCVLSETCYLTTLLVIVKESVSRQSFHNIASGTFAPRYSIIDKSDPAAS